MRHRLRAHQFLVHIGVPGQLLHIAVAADADETLAPVVAGVPEALHHAEHAEHRAVLLHEALARRSRVRADCRCRESGRPLRRSSARPPSRNRCPRPRPARRCRRRRRPARCRGHCPSATTGAAGSARLRGGWFQDRRARRIRATRRPHCGAKSPCGRCRCRCSRCRRAEKSSCRNPARVRRGNRRRSACRRRTGCPVAASARSHDRRRHRARFQDRASPRARPPTGRHRRRSRRAPAPCSLVPWSDNAERPCHRHRARMPRRCRFCRIAP